MDLKPSHLLMIAMPWPWPRISRCEQKLPDRSVPSGLATASRKHGAHWSLPSPSPCVHLRTYLDFQCVICLFWLKRKSFIKAVSCLFPCSCRFETKRTTTKNDSRKGAVKLQIVSCAADIRGAPRNKDAAFNICFVISKF